jgi:hypothetical protein
MNCGVCSGVFGEGSFCVSCGSSRDESDRLFLLNNPKRDLVADVRAFVAKNLIVIRRVALGSLLVFILGGAQAFLIMGIGPNQTLDRYISAIQDSDFTSLNDPSIFPGVDKAAGPSLVQFRDPESSRNASYEITERLDDRATAKVRLGPASSFELTLAPDVAYYGVFFITEWRVITEPPKLAVTVAKSLSDKQEVALPSAPDFLSVKELRSDDSLVEVSQSVLPGQYSADLSGLGFLQPTTVVQTLGAQTQTITLKLDSNVKKVTGKNLTLASRKAVNSVKSCLRAKCSAIPKLGEYDFNLWSQYPYSKYTSSRFNKNYSADSCTQTDTTAISPTRVRINFSCDYKAKAHLYVRWTYYSGWYSDYYYYWNLYDSKSLTMNASVEISTNEANTKETVGKASLR